MHVYNVTFTQAVAEKIAQNFNGYFLKCRTLLFCSILQCYSLPQRRAKMDVTDESYLHMYNAYRNRDDFKEVFASLLNTLGREVCLVSVKSGLILGPGEGLCEIGFMQKCAANIRKLTAVEQDHKSAEQLRHHFRKSLPNVEARVIESDFCTWNGLHDPVDLVVMFHMLYYCRPDERKQLVKKVYDGWLAADGFVVVMSASYTKRGNATGIFDRLGAPLLMWEDVEADFLEVGFVKRHVYEIQVTRDFSNPDEQFLRFYQTHAELPLTLNEVREAIKQLYPNGKADPSFNTLVVFQRA